MIKASLTIFAVFSAILFLGLSAQAATFTGTITDAAPTFDRPVDFTTAGSNCALSGVGTAVHYVVFHFTLTSSANVTISLSDNGATVSPPDADTFMILYGPGGFNPASGCTNAIISNDDADPSTLLSKIVTTSPLAAGSYTLVVTTFDNEPVNPSLPYSFTGFSSVAFNQQHVVDFDGDGKTDYSVIRDNNGQMRWYNVQSSTGATLGFDWGLSATDTQTPADFDGDGKTDIAVWRPGGAGNSFFYILQSNGFTVRIVNFGQDSDDPTVIGDYDGDGKADVAVYRDGGVTTGGQSYWFYLGSNNNPNGNITYVPWGYTGDFPAPGDYNGDGKYDFVVQRTDSNGVQARFYELLSNGTISGAVFGLPTDTIVPGDYDGDGKTDIATTRDNGSGSIQWQYLSSVDGSIHYFTFGLSSTDFPVQGDYDGDGKTDIAIWRPGSPGTFWIWQSSTGSLAAYQLGLSNDIPTANFNTH